MKPHTMGRGIGVFALLLVNVHAHARPDIFNAWRATYPDTSVGERGCQLCHERAEGGDGWNAYGFDIRTVYLDQLGSQNPTEAFRRVESFDSDFDEQGLSNLTEINRGLDPGWKPGRTNTIFFKDGTTLPFQAPPFIETLTDTSHLCFPITTSAVKTVLICL